MVHLSRGGGRGRDRVRPVRADLTPHEDITGSSLDRSKATVSWRGSRRRERESVSRRRRTRMSMRRLGSGNAGGGAAVAGEWDGGGIAGRMRGVNAGIMDEKVLELVFRALNWDPRELCVLARRQRGPSRVLRLRQRPPPRQLLARPPLLLLLLQRRRAQRRLRLQPQRRRDIRRRRREPPTSSSRPRASPAPPRQARHVKQYR